jgi:hypothetical protein
MSSRELVQLTWFNLLQNWQKDTPSEGQMLSLLFVSQTFSHLTVY